MSAVGTGRPREPEFIALSELIAMLNDLFEGDLTDADRVAYVDHVVGKLLENETLAAQAQHNTKEQFALGAFDQVLEDAIIEGLDHYRSIASQVLGNDAVKARFSVLVRDLVYDRLTHRGSA